MPKSTGVGIFRAVPLLIGIFSLGTTIIVSRMLSQGEADKERDRLRAEEQHVVAQLKVGAQQSFDELSRIDAWWKSQSPPTAPEDWAADRQLFLKKAGLISVTRVDAAMRRAWSVTADKVGQESAITDPQLRHTLEIARRSHNRALSDFFELEGAPAFYACLPTARAAGFICGLYNAAVLVQDIVQEQRPDQFAVVVHAPGHPIIVPKGPDLAARAAAAGPGSKLVLDNVNWFVTLIPLNPNAIGYGRAITAFGLLISILLYACAAEAQMASDRAAQLADLNRRLETENVERLRAEQSVVKLNQDLQRRLDEFQTLLDVLPIGIAVTDDPDCRNIWVNRALANLLQVPVGQNISKSGPEAGQLPYTMMRDGMEIPPEELPMQVASRTGQRLFHVPMDVVRPDGAVFHTLSYAAPVFDENGKVRGVIDACVDVTEHLALEGRVHSSEKYRSLALMAGGIAHDFNNLLTVIIGQAAAVSEHLMEHSAAAHAARELTEAANRATRLVSQLMAFTGNLWFEWKPLNLSAEIAAIKKSLQEIAPPSATLQFELPPDLPTFQAGESELRQVVTNLVANAAEALLPDQPGEILIRLSACDLSIADLRAAFPEQALIPGQYVRLEVIDNGSGVPRDAASRIFDPFFTTKFVGRGLGLSAVQGIVRAHGGAVRLIAGPHTGTCAEVIFPVASARQMPGAKPPDEAEFHAHPSEARLKAG